MKTPLQKTCYCYATGMCYTLSRRAMELVAKGPLLDPAVDKFFWAEDYTVGKILRANGIRPKRHPGWLTNPVSHR